MSGPNTQKHLTLLGRLQNDGVATIHAQASAMGLSKGYIRHLRHLLRREAAKRDQDRAFHAACEELEAAELTEISIDDDGDNPPPSVRIPYWYGR